MSRLRDLLIEQYAHHYSRVNISVDPNRDRGRTWRDMKLMYGPLVESLSPGNAVLDLGCGTGILLDWLSSHPSITAIGVDSSPSQAESVRRMLPDVNISCQDGLEYLRDHSRSFAGIFCLDVLEHLHEDDACLDWVEAARLALVPGGFFVCRTPNAANLTGAYSRYMDLTHERVFTRTSLLQLLEAAGFQQCCVIPVQSSRLLGRLRLWVERSVHRLLFRICGRGLETVFTSNVIVVGFNVSPHRGG